LQPVCFFRLPLDVAVATMLFFAGGLLLSRLLYKWHVRDRPY